MADHRHPKPGEVWERDGKRRRVVVVDDRCDWIWYQRELPGDRWGSDRGLLYESWVTWANKATCIKEATDERRDV